MNVLIVSAHPDDSELGMAGTIRYHITKGDNVFSVLMSNGEAIGNSIQRKKEAKVSAKFLGIKKIYFLNFQDRCVPDGFVSIKKIAHIIKENNIKRIYTHSPKDTHQDHRNTCCAVLSAAKQIEQILFFESPSSDVDFRPTFFVDIYDFISDKIKSLELYISLLKLNKRYLEINAIKNSASFRGYQCGLKYAESFEVFRFIEK